jgi:hypothetical protein
MNLRGKVTIAETGKKDSTIIVMLYRNVDDSAVQKRKPNYITHLDSSGILISQTFLKAGINYMPCWMGMAGKLIIQKLSFLHLPIRK